MALSRIALATAIGLVLAAFAGSVFDATQWPLFVAPAVVGCSAALVHRRRWPVRVMIAAGATLLGVVAAVLIAGGSVGEAIPGVLRGPRRLVTSEWPSPGDPTIIGTIALLVAATTAISADLAGRPQLHLTPLLPPVAAAGTLFALGAPVRPPMAATVAASLLIVAMMLLRPGVTLASRGRTVLGERTLAASMVVIALSAVAASTVVAWDDRASPRRVDDAEVTDALVNPIESVVALREIEPPVDLFELTDRSTLVGQSLPARWRLAALDSYDGQRWVPTITLRPIGGRLGIAASASANRVPPIDYDVRFLTDDFELVPFPGRPLSVSVDVETDLQRVVVRPIEPTGDRTIEALAEVAPNSAAGRTAMFATRQIDDIAATFSELAVNLAGEGTVDERLRQIERTMREEWQLDPVAPGSGQQLALIERFVTDTRRGSEEQFATAFVLLARALGFDARIATGFVVPPDELGAPLRLSSDHAAVWPEVQLDTIGWLAFDPAPPRPATDEDEPPPPPEAQSPAAAQPPIAPPAETGDDSAETRIDTSRDRGRWAGVVTWATRAATVGGLAILPLLIAVAAIIAAKLLRRRRRLGAAVAAHRVRGAWANATDSLIDAGLTIAPSWTDDHIARQAAVVAPTAPHEARRLAAMATAMTFGDTGDGERLVDDAVLTATAIDTAILADRTRWEQLRWRLSLRSFRRRTRSPVAA